MKKKGFTLIELLIVVAIIAILAAIAVPNFLEAQVRSKVSRAKSDLRTCATALESYAVDHNRYPPDGYQGIPDGSNWWALNYLLTTPIAYITSIDSMIDPFKTTDQANYYRYMNFKFTYEDQAGMPNVYRDYAEVFGVWAMSSWGPDKEFGPPNEIPSLWAAVYRYDATNGTVSDGDVIRCQKHSDTPPYDY